MDLCSHTSVELPFLLQIVELGSGEEEDTPLDAMLWIGKRVGDFERDLLTKTDLNMLQRRPLNVQSYIRDILEEYVVLFAPYRGSNFLFINDNVQPHVTDILSNYLDEVCIRTLKWRVVAR